MSKLNLKTYVNKNKKSNAYGKTYGRLQTVDVLTTDDLCRHIQKHGSVFTAAEVKGVTEKLISCIVELLLEGNKVKLDGLGIFYLSVSTTGEENAEDFNVSNIRRVSVRFQGDRSKESDYATAMLTRKAAFRIVSNTTAGNTPSGDSSGENSGGNGSNGEEAGEDRP